MDVLMRFSQTKHFDYIRKKDNFPSTREKKKKFSTNTLFIKQRKNIVSFEIQVWQSYGFDSLSFVSFDEKIQRMHRTSTWYQYILLIEECQLSLTCVQSHNGNCFLIYSTLRFRWLEFYFEIKGRFFFLSFSYMISFFFINKNRILINTKREKFGQ